MVKCKDVNLVLLHKGIWKPEVGNIFFSPSPPFFKIEFGDLNTENS